MLEAPLTIVLELARMDTPEDPYAFCLGRQEYTLRTTRGGRKRVALDWDDALLADIDALRRPRCPAAVPRRLARLLTTFLEPAGWTWYARDIGEAVEQQQPVVLALRSAAAELYALPWELLMLGGSGRCLGELPGVLLRYEWPETSTAPRAVVVEEAQPRLLFAWSAAAAAVPAAEHLAAMAEASEAAHFDFDPQRDVIAHVSYGRLADALEAAAAGDRPIGALHLLCHGGQDGDLFGVVLNGEDDARGAGDAVVVDGWRLRQLLGRYAATLRLVVVAACNSGRSGPFDSLAQSLHRAGIEAVVASRLPLSTAGSVRMAAALYKALLADGTSIEEAFVRARQHVARDATSLDWASLQLYARERDGGSGYPLLPPKEETLSQRNDTVAVARVQLSAFGLPGLVRLEQRLRRELARRFERELAVVAIADAGMVAYAARYGRAAARERQQLLDRLLGEATAAHNGRVATIVGGSDCACFEDAGGALQAVLSLLDALAEANHTLGRARQVVVQVAIHHGPVLTDGEVVVGPGAELTRRMLQLAANGEVLLSREARARVGAAEQLYCRRRSSLATATGDRLQIYGFGWREQRGMPSSLRVRETGETHALPLQDVISCGRLRLQEDGSRANDVFLSHPEPAKHKMISRSHFELHRRGDRLLLKALSSQPTMVGTRNLTKGEQVSVTAGSQLCLSNVLTLELLTSPQPEPVTGNAQLDPETTAHAPPSK